MTDIATLGLAIDSRQVTAASTALDQLTRSAKPAADGASRLEKASADSAVDMKALGKALDQTVGDLAVAAAGSDTHSESLRGQRKAVSGLAMDLALLAPQLGGAAQAASALYFANAYLSRGWDSVKGSIASLLTPMNLMLGVTAGLALGAYAMNSAWQESEKQFNGVAKAAGVTLTTLHALESASAFKGIDTKDFLDASEKFAGNVYQAKNNMGGLAAVFQANNVTAGDFTDHLLKAADLIKNATSDQQRLQLLQQMGLPATMQWVKFLSQGADGIRAAMDEAVKLGGAMDEHLIAKAKEFDEQWDKAWKNFSTFARSSFVNIKGWFDELSLYGNAALEKMGVNVGANLLKAGLGTKLGTNFDDFYKATNAPSGQPNKADTTTVDPAVAKRQIELEQQRIGVLGALADVEQQVSQKENELRLARMQPGSQITDADVSRISAYTRAQALGTLAIQQQASAQRIAGGEVGLAVGAAAAYRAEQEKLADFRLRGITLTDAQTAAIRKEAAALGEATQAAALRKATNDASFATSQLGRTDVEAQVATQLRTLYGDDYQAHLNDALAGQIRLNTALADAKSVASSAFSGMLNDLRAGKNSADIMRGALDKVAAKLADIAANSLSSAIFGSATKSALGGLFGGTSGDVGSILGGKTGAFHSGGMVGGAPTFSKYVHPSYFDDAPRFHDGGLVSGEVPIIAKKGEGVFTPDQMKALAPVNSSSGGGGGVTITNHYEFNGVDPSMESRLRTYIDQGDRRSIEQAVQMVPSVSRNTPSYNQRLR